MLNKTQVNGSPRYHLSDSCRQLYLFVIVSHSIAENASVLTKYAAIVIPKDVIPVATKYVTTILHFVSFFFVYVEAGGRDAGERGSQ